MGRLGWVGGCVSGWWVWGVCLCTEVCRMGFQREVGSTFKV